MNYIKRQMNNKKYIRYIIYVVLLTGVYGFNITQRKFPYFIPDEFAYWSVAAKIHRFDWSDVMSLATYYGYGYGVLLSLVVGVKNVIIQYYLAESINIILLIFSFCILNLIFSKLFISVDEKKRESICFIAMLYPSNIVYAHMTLSECLLVFLYISSVWVFLRYWERPSINNIFLLSLIMFLMVSVHLRSLAIVIALFFSVLFFPMRKEKKSYLQNFILFLLIGIMIGIVWVIKNYMVQSLFTGRLGIIQDRYNDSISANISLLFGVNLEGFLKSMEGKVFYIGCASLLFIFIATYHCIKVLFIWKNSNVTYKAVFAYILLAFWGSLMLTILRMSIPDRFDQLMYGRYAESFLMPLLCVGLMVSFFEEENKKMELCCVVCLLFLALDLRNWLLTADLADGLFLQITGIAGMMSTNFLEKMGTISGYTLGVVCIVFFLYEIICQIKKKYCFFFIGIALIWIIISQNVMKNELFIGGEWTAEKLLDLSDEIKQREEEIFYLVIDDKEEREKSISHYFMFLLQYFLEDYSLPIMSEVQISQLEDENLLIVHKDLRDRMEKINYKIIWENEIAYIIEVQSLKHIEDTNG